MDLPRLLDEVRDRGAAYADVRDETIARTSVEWKDGEVRKAIAGAERGFGVRVLADGAWGLASTSREAGVADALASALDLAKAAAKRRTERVQLAEVQPATGEARWRAKRDPREVPLEEKADVARRAGEAARAEGIVSVRAAIEDLVVETRFVSTEGADLRMEVPRLLLQMELAARGDGQVVGYRARIGGTVGYEVFEIEDPEAKARESAESARRILRAKPCPSGVMPVICDPDLTGVFAHEAIGHACEADLVLAGESILAGRIGEKLGSDAVTIVDDPTVPMGYGSFPYDDEGVVGARKVLLEEGVLKAFIHSRETAGRLGMEANGGARAESYGAEPLVRMSNTLVEGGDWTLEEMVEDVKRGVLVKGTRGGQVDVAKGSFQFNGQEAVLIENGELTEPLRDVSLSGEILSTLRTIDAVGKDARLASPGICGKGQWVPVGDGGPHLRIARCRVGGGA